MIPWAFVLSLALTCYMHTHTLPPGFPLPTSVVGMTHPWCSVSKCIPTPAPTTPLPCTEQGACPVSPQHRQISDISFPLGVQRHAKWKSLLHLPPRPPTPPLLMFALHGARKHSLLRSCLRGGLLFLCGLVFCPISARWVTGSVCAV